MISNVIAIAAWLCTAAAIVIFARAQWKRKSMRSDNAEVRCDSATSGDELLPMLDRKGRPIDWEKAARFEAALPAPPADQPRLRKFAE